jgi:hypothetical protein
MADEAFAISPISARAAEPGEADYDAISAAFMETARGRWFLGEYAKRNRNADTRMVLDAVARIEENLAAQKQAMPDDRLPAALQAIRHAVDEAKEATAQAGASTEQSLAPIRSAAQAIREILMRLREIGADGRIYELMDAHVSVIETCCTTPDLADIGTALDTAFGVIEQRIREFEGGDTAPSPGFEMSNAASTGDDRTSPVTAAASQAQGIVSAPAEAVADAGDDAVLEMIALEMAAADFAEDEAGGSGASEPVEPAAISQAGEAFAVPEPPVVEPSLGASLIAGGIVRTIDASAADPVAPIRRMSQAEKIAFFS